MKTSRFLPVLLALSLSACATHTAATGDDAVRQRVVAELAQAQKDGSSPLTEKQFVYPNWSEPATQQRATAP